MSSQTGSEIVVLPGEIGAERRSRPFNEYSLANGQRDRIPRGLVSGFCRVQGFQRIVHLSTIGVCSGLRHCQLSRQRERVRALASLPIMLLPTPRLSNVTSLEQRGNLWSAGYY